MLDSLRRKLWKTLDTILLKGGISILRAFPKTHEDKDNRFLNGTILKIVWQQVTQPSQIFNFTKLQSKTIIAYKFPSYATPIKASWNTGYI